MRYLQHPYPGQLLPVPGLLPVVLLRLVLVDVDLVSPQMLEDLDPGRFLAEVEPLVVYREADGQLHGVTDVAPDAVDDDLLSLRHPVLLSTASQNRKHHALLEIIKLRRA